MRKIRNYARLRRVVCVFCRCIDAVCDDASLCVSATFFAAMGRGPESDLSTWNWLPSELGENNPIDEILLGALFKKCDACASELSSIVRPDFPFVKVFVKLASRLKAAPIACLINQANLVYTN